MEIKVIESELLSEPYDKRFVVVDKDTSEILDDAQGYGYKSIKKAYAAYSYKNRDKSKDKEKAKRNKHIKEWMKEHKDFVDTMDICAFEAAKESNNPGEEFNAKFIKNLLDEFNLEVDFTPQELLNVWKKR